MKKLMFVSVLLLILNACGATVSVRRNDLSFMNDEIVAPVAPIKVVKAPQSVKVVKTNNRLSGEDQAFLAAALGKDENEAADTKPVTCEHDKVLRKPITVTVQNFELDDKSDGKESSRGVMVLKTCCEARLALAADDDRLIASCD